MRNYVENVSIGVVKDLKDLMQCFTIRAAVYMAEQMCPYDEEFDGNDFSASHIIAKAGNLPIATMRLRYFGAFAKTERLAVLPDYRAQGIGYKVMKYTIELAKNKGFDSIYTHAQEQNLQWHLRLGFEDLGRKFAFSDWQYRPMILRLDASPSALTLDSGDIILNRPEGEWDRPGVLDLSAERSVGGDVRD